MAFQRRHREIQRPNTVGFEGEQQPENMASVRMTHVRQSAVKWTGSYQSSHTLPGLGTLQNCGVINFCCFKPQKKKTKIIQKQMPPFIPTLSHSFFQKLTVQYIYFQPLLYAFMKKYVHVSVYGVISGVCVYKLDHCVKKNAFSCWLVSIQL